MRRRLARLGAVLPVLAQLACVSLRPFDPDGQEVLGPDEGVLLVEVRTELQLGALRFLGAPAVSNLAPGNHFVMLALSEGSYRWNEISFVAKNGTNLRWLLRPNEFLEFNVEAGRLNYVGSFEFDGEERGNYLIWSGALVNRSGEIAPRLRKSHPDLFRRVPPRFGGWHRDDYLDYFGGLAAGREETEPEAPGS